MMALWILAFVAGVALIVWGAESFAENLGAASIRLGVSSFALALLLAGAEPEELATVVAAALKGAPGLAIGDVIGANVTICLVALGVGAWVAPLPFRASAMRYALLGLPLGILSIWFAWDGVIGRKEGAVLVALYAIYVGAIWIAERRPPSLGEVGKINEVRTNELTRDGPRRIGRELLLVAAGIAAMTLGGTLLVEAVQRLTGAEATQTRLGLTIVGFATGFELVVLAWSAARRGASDVVVAGVVGSFAYNVTMTLGAGALARPLLLQDAATLHGPLLTMLAALALVIALAARDRQIGRPGAYILLGAYPIYIWAALSLNVI